MLVRYKTDRILLVIFVFLLHTQIFADDYKIKVIQSSSTQITLQAEFNKPLLINEEGNITAYYSSSKAVVGPNDALLPSITKLINLGVEDARLSIRMTDVEYQSERVENYRTIKNLPVGTPRRSEIFETKYLGKYRDLPLYALRILPVKYDPASKKITWLHKAQIVISSGGAEKPFSRSIRQKEVIASKSLSGMLLNPQNNTYSAPPADMVVEQRLNDELFDNPVFDGKDHIYKIKIKEDGLYKITYDDLVAAGYPVSLVNPKKLRLYNKGIETPIYFAGSEDNQLNPNDYFEFWGEKNEKTFYDQFPEVWNDPFTEINVYWLVQSMTNGVRMVEENGSLAKTKPGSFIRPTSFRETVHYEKNNRRETFGDGTANLNHLAYEIDHWFYDEGVSAVESRSYEFTLNSPSESGAGVYVTAAFRGKSIQTNVYHQLSLWLNEQKVGEVGESDYWMHQQAKFLSNDDGQGLMQDNLKDGVNILRVDMEQQGVTDMVLLNWFNISYSRQYKAANDYLKFSVQKNLPKNITPQFEINGFSEESIQIYKLGISKIVNGNIDYYEDYLGDESIRISFQDDVFDPEIQYVALTEKMKKKPIGVEPYEYWNSEINPLQLLDHSNVCDYLIITHSQFAFNSERLKELKLAQGLNPQVVFVDQIYDVFNKGIKSPLAIKDFIRYVYQNWDKTYRLEYVVLVGDAAYDYGSSDKTPTILFETVKFGSASADYWYSLISGDDYIPDIVVSRIPATDNVDLSNYIKKVDSYQNDNQPGAWRNKALFISGNDAGTHEAVTNKPVFRAQNLRLINRQLPKEIFARCLNTAKDEELGDDDPDFGSTTDLIELFDEGLSFINFLGHGGGAIWSDVQLMNNNDVNRLNNQDKYPFVSSLTCFTGAFENAGHKSLGEALLLADEKGAIGVLASSGVGWVYNDFSIGWSQYDFLWQEELSIGQAINLMKIYYQSDPTYFTDEASHTTYSFNKLYLSMIFQFNLFGDPALHLKKPSSQIDVQVSDHTPLPGDTVTVNIASGISGATGRLEIVDERNYRIVETDFSSDESYKFVIPDSSEGTIYHVKVYQENGSTDAHGYTSLSVRSSLIKNVVITPQNPQVNEPIHFRVVVKSYAGVDTMTLIDFSEIRNKHKFIYGFKIPMTKVNDTLFQSLTPFPEFENGGHKLFDIQVGTSDQEEIIFRWQKMYVLDNRPELTIVSKSFGYSGKDSLKISCAFANESDSVLHNVPVAFYTGSGIQNGQAFAQGTLNLLAHDEQTIDLHFSPDQFEPSRNFRVIIDPDNLFAERNENNNTYDKTLETDHVLIEKGIGTSLDKINNDTLILRSRWFFHIPKQVLSKSTILKFSEIETDFGNQSGINPLIFNAGNDPVALKLNFANFQENVNSPAYLSVADTVNNDSKISFYRFDEALNLWVRQNSVFENKSIKTEVHQSGIYTVCTSSDSVKPYIEITVDGQKLFDGKQISKLPNIAFIIQDINGIDVSRHLNIEIDGTVLSREDLSYPDEIVNPNSVSVLATPTLEPGEHTIKIEVSDVNGNQTVNELAVSVASAFDFMVYGNYPNPFSAETRISYNVVFADLDDLTVKIYTVSGKLIRTRMLYDGYGGLAGEEILKIGYNELIWDGTDDDGNQVANGVYFCVVEGAFQGEKVSHTIKMARLQ